MSDLLAAKPAMPSTEALDAAVGLTAESLSPKKQAYLRFMQHKGAVAAVVLLVLLLLWVLLSPITARYGVNEAIFDIKKGNNVNLAPRSDAWFGTDSIGRDLYSRIIYGLRVSLVLGVVAGFLSLIVGVAIGSAAGLYGGKFDDIMMRVTDIFLSFPFLVALLVARSFLGAIPWLKPVMGNVTSLRFIIILFTIFGWMGVARLVRAQVLSFKEREFIESARAIGATNRHVMLRHILPNSIGPLLVSLSFGIVGAIAGEATLSLFGYGPNPGEGSTSLGVLVADSRQAARAGYWWLAVFPFLAFLLVTLAISFIADGLRDATDPKSSQGKAS